MFIGGIIFCSIGLFGVIKYGLKRRRGKRLNRLGKKYNRTKKGILYSLYGVLMLTLVVTILSYNSGLAV